MNLGKTVVLILCAILLTIGATQVFYYQYKYLSSKDIPMYVEVSSGKVVGLNTRIDALYFGKIPVGESGRRFIDVTNSHEVDANVQILSYGDIATWVIPSENDFILRPDQTREITVDIFIPGNIIPGNYTGRMLVTLKRA